MKTLIPLKTIGLVSALALSPLAIVSCDSGDGTAPTTPNNNGGTGGNITKPDTNALEQELSRLIKENPDQRRITMTRNDILAQYAREKAEDMATNNYFSHTDTNGKTPNQRVAELGYSLPAEYPLEDNSIESITAGHSTAAEALAIWLNDPQHREHILAETPFRQNQVLYGVGVAYNPNSTWKYYWVFVSAPQP